jgi:hypothetical protein
MSPERRLFDSVWAAVDDLVSDPAADGAECGDRNGSEILGVRRSDTVVVTIRDDGTEIEAACIDGWGWVVLGADGAAAGPVNTCAFAERLDPRAPGALDRLLRLDGTDDLS